MSYQSIEDYGIVGNMHTVALVCRSGSIDWFCHPRFDSPSVFAALLDSKKGGHFVIEPVGADVTLKQFYWPETNVLVTRFLSSDGVGQIVDYMPVGESQNESKRHWLVRRVQVVRGTMKFRLFCRPAFNYARDPHELESCAAGVRFHSRNLSLELGSRHPLGTEDNAAVDEFALQDEEHRVFVLRGCEPGDKSEPAMSEDEELLFFRNTVNFWRAWVSSSTYGGRWREIVYRSALTLKLLTYEPTGAIVAAPTAGLPEDLGGVRNWDYRYTWIRDAAFTLYGLMRIGFTQESARFMDWIDARARELEPDGSLQVLYGIEGQHELTEETLDHLEGYKGSRPVRVGNAASTQKQLDIYGELMDSVYLFNKYGSPISYNLWVHLRRMMNWVCENWQQKDAGIWEVRGGRQHFVYSKLMCWVALDRALRLAQKRSFPADHDRWMETRDRIYMDIMDRAWNPELEAFTQYYGSSTLDAANLLMPLVFFVSPTDPRMLSTLDAIRRSPERGGLLANSLVHRYNVSETDDGIEGEEGSFNICTFWLVEALTRARMSDPRLLDEARLMFEQMLGYSNHLGLYAEETGPRGEALGNFPQAFTHLALISAAYNLDRALGPVG